MAIEFNPRASVREMKNLLHTLGKRAQARIKSLEKAYGQGGSLAGRKSYVLDQYGDFNTKTKGLSENALRAKVEKAINILNAQTSTVAGVKDVDRRRYETYMRNHPEARVQVLDKDGNPLKDRKGNYKTKPLTLKDYIKGIKAYDKLKQAETEGKFSYEEQMYAGFQLGALGEIHYGNQTIKLSDVLENEFDKSDSDSTTNEALPFSIHDYFSSLSPELTVPFLSVDQP